MLSTLGFFLKDFDVGVSQMSRCIDEDGTGSRAKGKSLEMCRNPQIRVQEDSMNGRKHINVTGAT